MGRIPLRLFVNLGLYTFISLVGFFCYAVQSTSKPKFTDGKRYNGATGAIAAGYFFIFLLLVIYWLLTCVTPLRERFKTPLMEFIFTILFVFFALILVIGYWAQAGDFKKQPPFYNFKEYGRQYAGYMVGISFVNLFMCFFFACDIQMGKYFSRFIDEPVARSEGGMNNNNNDNDGNDEYGGGGAEDY